MKSLYRAFGEDGALLYVGITCRGAARLRQHSAASSWWKEASTIRLRHFATDEEAEEAERVAIRAEHPRYNVKHNVPIGFLSIDEVAERFSVTRYAVRDWALDGRLRGQRVGNRWFFDPIEVSRWTGAVA